MSNSGRGGGGLAYRARVVCVRCHERKVRCDLQDRPEGSCRNCQREGIECRRRKGVRKRADPSKDPLGSNIISFAQVGGNGTPNTAPAPSVSSSGSTPPNSNRVIESTQSNQPRSGYFGDGSICSYPEDSDQLSKATRVLTLSGSATETILYATHAAHRAPKSLADAVVDFYFDHMWQHIPVADRSDLEGPNSSLMLQNAVYFAGTLMRRSTDYPALASPEDYYLKVKTLLFVNHEKDKVNILKTLCLIASWNPSPPDLITLESPWQWIGTAIRLAQQMGLHSETTYFRAQDPRINRRLWWCLFINEVLISTAYARPSIIHMQDCTVRLPDINDFAWPDEKALIFIHNARLVLILKTCQDLSSQARPAQADEVLQIFASLQSWLDNLPPQLRLYSMDNMRNSYNRGALELHILYFTIIVMLYLLPGQHQESRSVKTASIIAASCVARLYEEILAREEVTYFIPIHIWIIIVAAVPQFYCLLKFPSLVNSTHEEIDILINTLRALSVKHPNAAFFVSKINYFRNNVHVVPGLSTAPNTRSSSPGPGGTSQFPSNPEEYFTNIGALFPFPETLSPKMGLLTPPKTTGAYFEPVPLDEMSWSIDWNGISLDPAFSAFLGGFSAPP